MHLTRRAALGLGIGTVLVTGCHDHGSTPTTRPTSTPARVPDAAALATARRGELHLLAAYEREIRHAPLRQRGPLRVERAIHLTHLAALHGGDSSVIGAVGNVRHTLRASAAELRRLSLAATDGTNAALLASIAASHTASAT